MTSAHCLLTNGYVKWKSFVYGIDSPSSSSSSLSSLRLLAGAAPPLLPQEFCLRREEPPKPPSEAVAGGLDAAKPNLLRRKGFQRVLISHNCA